MLRENLRLCDVCDRQINRGEKYNRQIVPSERADLFRSMIEVLSNGRLRQAWTQDERGQIILDLCLDCYLSMSISDRRPV